MKESLLSRIAIRVLSDSLNVQEGDAVTVETWNNGLPLALKVILEAKKIGATPLLIFEDEATFVQAAKTLPKEKVGRIGKHELGLLSQTDAYVFIPGPPMSSYYKGLTPAERTASTAYNVTWYEAAAKARLRGATINFGYVDWSMGRLLGKPPKMIINHLLKASLVDLKKIRSKSRTISRRLKEDSQCSVISQGGTVEFALKGEPTVEDGVVDAKDIRDQNSMTSFPPGLVSREVDPKSVSGSVTVRSIITSTGPTAQVMLRFDQGKLVSWSSEDKNPELNQLFTSIPEAFRSINTVEIGLNELLRYGFSQDRFVEGAISLRVGNIRGVVRGGGLSVGGRDILKNGQLILR